MVDKEGKYSFIKKARQPDDQISGGPEDQKEAASSAQPSGKPDSQKGIEPEKQVNLCVKVPESWRRHWAAHSKLQGVTMTDVMVEALKAKFGLPENQ
jgi:hypothetical protein